MLESLQYLNHPLREAHARAVRPARRSSCCGDSADRRHLLPDALDGAHAVGPSLAEAAATVRDFLAQELQYPQRLRWTILSAADELFRAAALSAR